MRQAAKPLLRIIFWSLVDSMMSAPESGTSSGDSNHCSARSPPPSTCVLSDQIDHVFQTAIQLLSKFEDASPTKLVKSASFKNIVGHLFSPHYSNAHNLNKSCRLFEGIDWEEFSAIEHLVDDTYLFGRRQKLCYFPDDEILIVRSSCAINEMPLTDLMYGVSSAVDSLPYNKKILRAGMRSNLTLISSRIELISTPDLFLYLTSSKKIL